MSLAKPLDKTDIHTAFTTQGHHPIDRQLGGKTCHGCAAKLTFFPLCQQAPPESKQQQQRGSHVNNNNGNEGSSDDDQTDADVVTTSEMFAIEYDIVDESTIEERAVEATHCFNCGGLFCYRCASLRCPESLQLGLVLPALRPSASECAGKMGIRSNDGSDDDDDEAEGDGFTLPLAAFAYTHTTPQESAAASTQRHLLRLYEDEALAEGYVGAGVGNFVTASAAVQRASNIFGAIAGAVSSVFSGDGQRRSPSSSSPSAVSGPSPPTSCGGNNNNNGGAAQRQSLGNRLSFAARLRSGSSSIRRSVSSRRRRDLQQQQQPSEGDTNNPTRHINVGNNSSAVGASDDEHSNNSDGGEGEGEEGGSSASSLFENLQAKEFKNRPIPLCTSCFAHDIGYLLAFCRPLRSRQHLLLFSSQEIAMNYARLHVPKLASRLILHIGSGTIVASRFADDEAERQLIEGALRERQRVKGAASRHFFSKKTHFSRQLGVLADLSARLAKAEAAAAAGVSAADPLLLANSSAATASSSSSSSSISATATAVAIERLRAQRDAAHVECFPFTSDDLALLQRRNNLFERDEAAQMLIAARAVVRISDEEMQRNFDLLPTDADDGGGGGADDSSENGGGSGGRGGIEEHAIAAEGDFTAHTFRVGLPPPPRNSGSAGGIIGDSTTAPIPTAGGGAAADVTTTSGAAFGALPSASASYALLESAHRLSRGRDDLDDDDNSTNANTTPADSAINRQRCPSTIASDGDSVAAMAGGDTSRRMRAREMAGAMLPDGLMYARGGATAAAVNGGHRNGNARNGNALSLTPPPMTHALCGSDSTILVSHAPPREEADEWVRGIAAGHFADADAFARRAVTQLLRDRHRKKYGKKQLQTSPPQQQQQGNARNAAESQPAEEVAGGSDGLGAPLAAIEGCAYYSTLLVVYRSGDGRFEHCVVPSVTSIFDEAEDDGAENVVNGEDLQQTATNVASLRRSEGVRIGRQMLRMEPIHGPTSPSSSAASPPPLLQNVSYGCVIDLAGRVLCVVNNVCIRSRSSSSLIGGRCRRRRGASLTNRNLNPRTNRLPSPTPAGREGAGATNGPSDGSRAARYSPSGRFAPITGDSPSNASGAVTSGGAVTTSESNSWTIIGERGNSVNFGLGSLSPPTATGAGVGVGDAENNDEGLVSTPRGVVDSEGFSSIAHGRGAAAVTGGGASGNNDHTTPRQQRYSPPQQEGQPAFARGVGAKAAAAPNDHFPFETSIARECLFYALSCISVVRAVAPSSDADAAATRKLLREESGEKTKAGESDVAVSSLPSAPLSYPTSAAAAVPTTDSRQSQPAFTFYRSPFTAMAALFASRDDAASSELLLDQYGNILAARNMGSASSHDEGGGGKTTPAVSIAAAAAASAGGGASSSSSVVSSIAAAAAKDGLGAAVAARDILARRAGKAMQTSMEMGRGAPPRASVAAGEDGGNSGEGREDASYGMGGQRLTHLFVVVPMNTNSGGAFGGASPNRQRQQQSSSRLCTRPRGSTVPAIAGLGLSSSRHHRDLVESLSTPRGGTTPTGNGGEQRRMGVAPATASTTVTFATAAVAQQQRGGSSATPPPPSATAAHPSAGTHSNNNNRPSSTTSSTPTATPFLVDPSEGEVLVLPCTSLYDAANLLRDYQTGICAAMGRGDGPADGLHVHCRHPSVGRRAVVALLYAAARSPMLTAIVSGHRERLRIREEAEGGMGSENAAVGREQQQLQLQSTREARARLLGAAERDRQRAEAAQRRRDEAAAAEAREAERRAAAAQRQREIEAAAAQREVERRAEAEAKRRLEEQQLREREAAAAEQRRRAALLECPICMEAYNVAERRPCLCPSCGNTFCLECAAHLDTCGFCRARIGGGSGGRVYSRVPANNNGGVGGNSNGHSSGIGSLAAAFLNGVAGGGNASAALARRQQIARGGGGGAHSMPVSSSSAAAAAASSPSNGRFLTNVALMHMLEGGAKE